MTNSRIQVGSRFGVPMITFGDAPRARRTDPITSHQAADGSAAGLSQMKQNILGLFREFGAMTDSELNDRYQQVWEERGWKPARPDTPRKRRSDLVAEGYLFATSETRVNGFGSAEQVWAVV